MHDAVLVRDLEGLGDLSRDRQRVGERHRSLRDSIGERLPANELQHKRVHGAAVVEAVDVADVGVAERGEELRFATEAGEPLAVGGKRLRQNLERDVAIEFGVAGAIDLAHAARANQRDDLVRAERRAGRERHEGMDESAAGRIPKQAFLLPLPAT
jgi:hypothetical protein